MAGYIGSKSSVTLVDGYTEAEADAEFVNDPNGAITVDGSNVGIGTSSPTRQLDVSKAGTAYIRASDTSSSVNMEMLASSSGGWIGTQTNHSLNFQTNNSERMRIDSSGNVRLANTSMNIDNSGNTATGLSVASTGVTHIATSGNNTSLVIQRVSDTGTDYAVFFMYGSAGVGSITVNGSSTAYNTSSDYRLKENVVDLTGASARVNQLNPSRFNFIADGTDTAVDGFLAHEVATVVPEAITGTKDAMKDEEYEVTPAVLDDDGNVTTEAVMGTRSVPDYQGIDQSKLVPLLTAALQEALTEIASLKTRVEALEA